MLNITFTIIKPDAFLAGYYGLIINDIIQAGFKIKAMKLLHLKPQQAADFYAVHKDKPFYQELITFMSSAPIVVAILEKQNAVEDFRKLIGATNPAMAELGTIRKKYAQSIGENAIHGSDSEANALMESEYFFTHLERVQY